MIRLSHIRDSLIRHLSVENGAVGRQPNELVPFNGL